MSDKELVYRLYLDGLDGQQTVVITKQLEMVNRIGKTTNGLVARWETTSDRAKADAMYLRPGHSVGDLTSIAVPVLTDEDVPRGYLHKHIIPITQPHTAVLLINWLEQAEDLIAMARSDKAERPLPPPPGPARGETLTRERAESGSDAAEEGLSGLGAGAGDARERAISRAPGAVGPQGGASPTAGDGASRPHVPAPARPKARGGERRNIPFTHIIRDTKRDLLLSWGNDKVWYSAFRKRFFTDLGDAPAVVERIFERDPLIAISDGEPPAELPFITYDSLMWSYGLRAEPSRVFLANAAMDRHKFKLSKWPLFGQWETSSKLLLVSALFTQKFSSVPEVAHKTGRPVDETTRFLYAAYLSNIPIERETLSSEDLDLIRDLGSSDEHKIKNIAWIDQLREKLKMRDYL